MATSCRTSSGYHAPSQVTDTALTALAALAALTALLAALTHNFMSPTPPVKEEVAAAVVAEEDDEHEVVEKVAALTALAVYDPGYHHRGLRSI